MKNITSYFFGQLTNGFDATVRDHTKDFFQELATQTTSAPRLYVKRRGQLMFYTHVVPLQSGGCFGVCLVLNGLAFSRFSRLFACLQDFVGQLILHGDIIGLNKRGKLVAQAADFVQVRAAVEQATGRLQNEVDRLCDVVPLPELDHSRGNEGDHLIDLSSATAHDVFARTIGHGRVILQDAAQADRHLASKYRGHLLQLLAEKGQLEEDYSDLKQRFRHLQQQKKSLALVAGLLLLLFAGGGAALYYQNSLKEDIEQREGEISDLNGSVMLLNDRNASMSETLKMQRDSIDMLGQELEWRQGRIDELQQERDSLVEQVKEYESLIETVLEE